MGAGAPPGRKASASTCASSRYHGRPRGTAAAAAVLLLLAAAVAPAAGQGWIPNYPVRFLVLGDWGRASQT